MEDDIVYYTALNEFEKTTNAEWIRMPIIAVNDDRFYFGYYLYCINGELYEEQTPEFMSLYNKVKLWQKLLQE